MRSGWLLLRVGWNPGVRELLAGIISLHVLFASADAWACSPPPPPPPDETANQRLQREAQLIRAREDAARVALEDDRRMLQDSRWIYVGRVSRIVSSAGGRPPGFPNTTIWVRPVGKAIKGQAPRSLKVSEAGGFPGVCGGRTGYDYLPDKVGDEVLVLGGDTVLYRNYIYEIAQVGGDRANRLVALMVDTPTQP